MIGLRNAVHTADKNNTNVQEALDRLQAYVTAHMNTNLSTSNGVYPPVQLNYTYGRLVDQAKAAAVAAQTTTPIYTEAQAYCEQQDPVDFSGHNRVPCIEQYVLSHGGAQAPTPPVEIPSELYEFSFASPTWSPDLAGWSMVIVATSGSLCLVTFIVDRWFRRNVA
jgi:hypothetical protein